MADPLDGEVRAEPMGELKHPKVGLVVGQAIVHMLLPPVHWLAPRELLFKGACVEPGALLPVGEPNDKSVSSDTQHLPQGLESVRARKMLDRIHGHDGVK